MSALRPDALPRCLLAAALLVVAACGREPARQAPQAAPPGSAAAAPFAVFSRSSMVIDRLGVQVAAPVTVGSRPSDTTMSSDAPQIVTVDPSGNLVAHQDGVATIRSAGGALEVVVRTARSIALVPRRLALRPGETGRLRAVEGDGPQEIAAGAVEWATSDPRIATLFGGEVMAGRRSGSARITARYGGRQAEALITVGEVRKGPR